MILILIYFEWRDTENQLLAPKKGAAKTRECFSVYLYFFEPFSIFYNPHNYVIPQAMPHANPQTPSAFYPHRWRRHFRDSKCQNVPTEDASALKHLCLWCEFQSRLLFIISLLLLNGHPLSSRSPKNNNRIEL